MYLKCPKCGETVYYIGCVDGRVVAECGDATCDYKLPICAYEFAMVRFKEAVRGEK